MSWSHEFCLYCDKQTSEGAYCSQACRVADLEKSQPSTPFTLPLYNNQSTPHSASQQNYYSYFTTQPLQSQQDPKRLSTSSSQTSLSSYSSTSTQSPLTSASQSGLSSQAYKDLRDYADSFDQMRHWKRKSSS